MHPRRGVGGTQDADRFWLLGWESSNKDMASAYVMFLVYKLLCVVNLLQAQLFDQQDCEILASVKNTMAGLPGGISVLSTWEFAANVDPCESFTGVECITVDGVNRVGSLFLGPQFAGGHHGF